MLFALNAPLQAWQQEAVGSLVALAEVLQQQAGSKRRKRMSDKLCRSADGPLVPAHCESVRLLHTQLRIHELFETGHGTRTPMRYLRTCGDVQQRGHQAPLNGDVLRDASGARLLRLVLRPAPFAGSVVVHEAQEDAPRVAGAGSSGYAACRSRRRRRRPGRLSGAGVEQRGPGLVEFE